MRVGVVPQLIKSISRFNLTRPRNSKIIAPLRRAIEKKNESNLRIVTALTVSEEINLNQVVSNFNLTKDVIIPDEVVNIRTKQNKDIMVLANGTLVGWEMDEEALLDFLPSIESAITEKYNFELEEMDYKYNEIPGTSRNVRKITDNDDSNSSNSSKGNNYRDITSETHMEGEVLVLNGSESDTKLILEKAAFAVGFSRSTRLAVLESALEDHIRLTRNNSVNLLKGKAIKTSEKDVLKLTGRLFLLRGKLNLYSELIETPDLYWAEPTLEKLYQDILRTLDISPRIAILNRKLDYATEEQRALLLVLNEEKSTRLEWIIIILIMVEVGFESFHFYERYIDDKNEQDVKH